MSHLSPVCWANNLLMLVSSSSSHLHDSAMNHVWCRRQVAWFDLIFATASLLAFIIGKAPFPFHVCTSTCGFVIFCFSWPLNPKPVKVCFLFFLVVRPVLSMKQLFLLLLLFPLATVMITIPGGGKSRVEKGKKQLGFSSQ